MAAAICLRAFVTTAQNDSLSDWANVTGASIPAGGGSGQLVVGRKYWILCLSQTRSASGGVSRGRLLHGSTVFGESEQNDGGTNGTTRHNYQFSTVWEAVSGEALQYQHYHNAGGSVSTDQVVLLALDLSELTENTDYWWHERADDDGLSTTPVNGATITLTPAEADSYLVVPYAQTVHGDTTTQALHRLVRSGEASSSLPQSRFESAVSGVDRLVGTLLPRAFTLGTASNTFTQVSEASSGTAHTRRHSSIFVLRGAAFAQFAFAWTDSALNLGTTSWGDQIQTLGITPAQTGDFVILGGFIFDCENISRTVSYRLQATNSDNPATQTSDEYPFYMRDNTEERSLWMATVAELATGAERTIDVDGHTSSTTSTPHAQDRFLIAFSLELGGTANTAPDPPTFENLVDEETGVAVDTPIDIGVLDPDGDPLDLEVEITDHRENWDGGEQLVDEQADSGGTRRTIHTNVLTGTTWEGHRKSDDRLGQTWRSKGGKQTRFGFIAGAFESNPSLTDGAYLAATYEAVGERGDETLTLWAATTVYGAGAKVKPTSTANANQRFVYVCTTPGTSAGSEPTWPTTHDDTVNDGTVVWTAKRGIGPANPAAADDTPTPGWLGRSDVVNYNPGAVDEGWKYVDFTGANRVRSAYHQWRCTIIDWRANDGNSDNGITIPSRFMGGGHAGSAYIDGNSAANVGPYVGDDMVFRAYETFLLEQHSTLTHPERFENLDDSGDTPPFLSGSTIRLTRPGDDLEPGVTYRIRARQRDPGGTNTWSSWATITITTAGGGGPETLTLGAALAPTTTLTRATSRPAARSLSPGATLHRAVALVHGGDLAPAGAAARAVLLVRGGTLASAGSGARETSQTRTRAVAPTGATQRHTAIVLTAALASAATLTAIKAALLTLTAALTPAVLRQHLTARTTDRTVAPATVTSRQTARVLGGALTPSAVLDAVAVALRTFTAALTPTATTVRQAQRGQARTVAPVSALARATQRTAQALVSPTAVAAPTRLAARLLDATLAPTATVQRVTMRLTGAILASTAALVQRATQRVLQAALTPIGGLTLEVPGTSITVLQLAGEAFRVAGILSETLRVAHVRGERLKPWDGGPL